MGHTTTVLVLCDQCGSPVSYRGVEKDVQAELAYEADCKARGERYETKHWFCSKACGREYADAVARRSTSGS